MVSAKSLPATGRELHAMRRAATQEKVGLPTVRRSPSPSSNWTNVSANACHAADHEGGSSLLRCCKPRTRFMEALSPAQCSRETRRLRVPNTVQREALRAIKLLEREA
jgi:hypothetical protein